MRLYVEDFVISQQIAVAAHLKSHIIRLKIWEIVDVDLSNGYIDANLGVFTNHRKRLFSIHQIYWPEHMRDPYGLLPLFNILMQEELRWLPKYAFRDFEHIYYDYTSSHRTRDIAEKLESTQRIKSIWEKKSAAAFHTLVYNQEEKG